MDIASRKVALIPLRVRCGGNSIRLDEFDTFDAMLLGPHASFNANCWVCFECGMSLYFPLYVLSVCVCISPCLAFLDFPAHSGRLIFHSPRHAECLLRWIDCFSMRSMRYIRTILWFMFLPIPSESIYNSALYINRRDLLDVESCTPCFP